MSNLQRVSSDVNDAENAAAVGEPVAREESGLSRLTSNLSRKASRISTRKTAPKKEIYPEQDLDKGIVGWEGQDDPKNPRRYTPLHKWRLLGLLSAIQFVSPFASTMFAPGVSYMDEEFHNTSSILSSFAVSVYVLGYAVGPLFISPLSEMLGRRMVLNVTTIIFTLFQIGCALAPNLSALIFFRLLTGIGGSGCLSTGSGVIADLFEKEQRGFASTIYSCGPLFGPILGPIVGGFVAELVGWRWIFWILLIAAGTVTTGILIFNRETNPKILMQRKAARLRKELNRDDLQSCYEVLHNGHPRSFKHVIFHGLLRPLKMFLFVPIVTVLSLYMAFLYGLFYLLLTTITSVYQTTYHWPADLSGLAYIGLGFGLMIGTFSAGRILDPSIKKLTKANNGVYEPEMRLKLVLPFACLVPISFFWYGWSVEAQTQWIVPIIGLAPFGAGTIFIYICIQTYIIDSYTEYAASGVACITVLRSLFGAFLPLVAPSLYASLGYGWGNSLLGFLALGMISFPIFLGRYGAVIRKKYVVNLE